MGATERAGISFFELYYLPLIRSSHFLPERLDHLLPQGEKEEKHRIQHFPSPLAGEGGHRKAMVG